MNLHILVTCGDIKSVETFSSRRTMTARRAELTGIKCAMLPPINVSRDAKGILYTAHIINELHTRDYAEVIEELEDEHKGS